MNKALLLVLALVVVPLVGSTGLSDKQKVACGGEYDFYALSSDGTSVCAGGKYNSYALSADGSDVACGGAYNSYALSGG